MNSLTELLGIDCEQWETFLDQALFDLRVAAPGIIQSFDPEAMTVVVQLAIREKMTLNSTWPPADIAIKPLCDVPLVILGNQDYQVTFPIRQGDECLVIFGDRCIDGWWQSGGVQNQAERRCHDLSDGFAIVGPRSLPKNISNYSQNSIQIRNTAGTALVEIAETTINVTAPTVNVGNSNVVIGNNTTIDGRVFLNHVHHSGNGATGGVV